MRLQGQALRPVRQAKPTQEQDKNKTDCSLSQDDTIHCNSLVSAVCYAVHMVYSCYVGTGHSALQNFLLSWNAFLSLIFIQAAEQTVSAAT